MAINKSVNTFEGGLVRTNNPIKQPNNTYSFALNAVINDIVTDNTSITNEKAFRQYFAVLADSYDILGWCWLGNEEYVLFVKGTVDEILYIDVARGINKTVYGGNQLKFSKTHEIKSTYRVNFRNQRIVYFVDGLNDDRVINIDIDNTNIDVSLISLGANSTNPIVEATVIDGGGNITSGQYFIGVSYNLGEDFTTSVTSLTNGISIASEGYFTQDFTSTNTREYGATDGEAMLVPTNKSILINLSNLDNNYTSYNIVIAKSDNTGGALVKVIKNQAITSDKYTYTGNEGVVDETINLNQIIVDTIKYYASEAITQKDNRLLRGNSKLASTQIDYQEFANNIKVKYKINEVEVFSDTFINNRNNSSSGSDHNNQNLFKHHSISPSYLANTANNNSNNKTLMRDEVYSLGIGFELLDGTTTDVFHISGRLPNVNINTSARGDFGAAPAADWDNSFLTKNTALNDGTLGYWRSDQVYTAGYKYPTNGETDSSGRAYIRHHRMPSDILEPIYRTVVSGDPNATNVPVTYTLYKRNLSLVFSNVEIPDKYKDVIKKVKFFYTPRTAGNKSILSKGILQGLSYDETKRQKQQSEGGLNDIGNTFEFISPDVNFKFKESNINGNRIKVNGLDKGYINYVDLYHQGIGNLDRTVFWFNKQLFDSTERRQKVVTSFVPFLERVTPKVDLESKRMTKAVFVDGNFKGTTGGLSLDFSGSQKTSVIELGENLMIKPSPLTTPVSQIYPNLRLPNGTNDTTSIITTLQSVEMSSRQEKPYYDTVYYISIVSDNRNLYGKIEDLQYNNYHNTDVKVNSPESTYEVYGGDTYIDMHHYKKTYSSVKASNDTLEYKALKSDGSGSEVIYEFAAVTFGSFMCETDINIRMRREGDKDTERYFPKSLYADSSINAYEKATFNEEFYKIEDSYNIQFLKYYFANSNKTEDYQRSTDGLRYSTRIIYSDKQELEDKFDNFRVARANNYRDLPLNRGPISLFFTKGNKLYTVTRDSLFDVFASNQTIKSENADNIVVGTGEFLSIEPQELISIDGGYGGSSSKLSLVESPYGYLFVDRKKNKCLLFDDSLKDINIFGLNENFKLELYKQFPALESENGFDSPVADAGIIAIYDPRLQRFLITKKDYRIINTDGVTVLDGILLKDGTPIDFNNKELVENKSFTVSFNPSKSKWVSYHSYIPKLYLPHETDFVAFNTQLELSNGDSYLNNFVIELISNDNPLYTKTFDSISTNVESYSNDGTKTNDFFTEFLVYNDQQSSGNIIINNTNVTKKEKDWNINKFLDKVPHNSTKKLFSNEWIDKKDNYYIDKVVHNLVQDSTKPWFQMGRMRDKYLIVRFTAKDLDNKKIIVNFVNTIYRVSTR